MFTLVKIAWRNILRNKKRSLITISAISFGLGQLLFIWAFVEGAHQQMIENFTSLSTSHIQIHKKGFHEKQNLESYVAAPDTILSKIKTSSFSEPDSITISEHLSGIRNSPVFRKFFPPKTHHAQKKEWGIFADKNFQRKLRVFKNNFRHWKDDWLKKLFPQTAASSPKEKNLLPIKNMTLRVKAQSLISSAESSVGILLVGIQPDQEKTVSSFHKRIKSGKFLDDNASRTVLIGSSLAKNLNVSVGDKVVFMLQALDGSLASDAFIVHGIIETSVEEIDKSLAIVPLGAAQNLLVMPDKISEIAIQLQSGKDSRAIAAEIAKSLNDSNLEVLSWQEAAPSFEQWIEFDNAFIWIIVIVIMLVVTIGILNTILMGVLERTREFGVLLALGTRPDQIVSMITWESIFLGAIGSAAGFLLGGALTMYFGKAGINLSIFTQALNSFYMDPIIYPQLQRNHMITSGGLVLFTSIIVSIYPAWHASRLKPIEAIRTI